MKKTFLLLLAAASLLFSCTKSSREPVYVNNFLLGPYVSEFAVNGPRQDMIAEIEPFIESGRVYFLCWAFPISSGSLRNGFEFNLDFEDEFVSSPRIKAVYRGSQRDDYSMVELCFVAGYAERRTIIITHAFLEYDKAEEWAKTVRLAMDDVPTSQPGLSDIWGTELFAPITEGEGQFIDRY